MAVTQLCSSISVIWLLVYASASCVDRTCQFTDDIDMIDTQSMLLQTGTQTHVSRNSDEQTRVTFAERSNLHQAEGVGPQYDHAKSLNKQRVMEVGRPQPIVIIVLTLAPLCLILVAVTCFSFGGSNRLSYAEHMGPGISAKIEDAGESSYLEPSGTLGNMAVAVMHIPRTVLTLTAFSVLMGAVGACFLMQVTSLSFEPLPGQYAYLANNNFNARFPNVRNASQTLGLLVVAAPAKVSDGCWNLTRFSYALRSQLNASGNLLTFFSNATAFDEHLVDVSSQLAAVNDSVLGFQWSIAQPSKSAEAVEFAYESSVIFDQLVNTECPAVSFSGLLGEAVIVLHGIEAGETELLITDVTSVVLAIMVLAFFLQSARLLVIPLINMAFAMSLSFGVVYCIGTVSAIASSTPFMMMSVLIATSLDYSLFFLTRFKEEIENVSLVRGSLAHAGSSLSALQGPAISDALAARVKHAVARTVESAGFMILTSGSLLALSFSMLISFRVPLIWTMGIGCATCIMMAILMHLTVSPVLLTLFPEFFVAGLPLHLDTRREYDSRLVRNGSDSSSVLQSPAIVGRSLAANNANNGTGTSRFWRSLADRTTTYPINVLLIFAIVVFVALVGSSILDMKTSRKLEDYMPRGSRVEQTFLQASRAFGPGFAWPYYVMLEPTREGDYVTSSEFWNISHQWFDSLVEDLHVSYSELQFIAAAGGEKIPLQIAQGCFTDTANSYKWTERPLRNYRGPRGTEVRVAASICPSIRYMFDMLINEDSTATYGLIHSAIDPNTEEGDVFFKTLRSLADEWMEIRPMRITISSTSSDSYDVRRAVYDEFPWMIGVTLTLCLFLIGLIFQSIVVPIRSVATICLTLVFVYGLGTWTYQRGLFNWTGHPGLSANGPVCWLSPVMSFTVIVGLCLDYDIFFLSRATEFRLSGEEPTKAVCMASYRTGSVMSAAGFIMMAAFGGQLWASMALASQFAFNMIFAAFFDAFVIRCVFAPASMSLLGRFNWWPSRLSKS